MSVTASGANAVCRGPGCQNSTDWQGYSRSDRLYCSDACRQRAYRKRIRDTDAPCSQFPGEECRWAPSCAADGCWRRECAEDDRPLYGIGPSARAAA